jgi:minor extracellular serine protease Vpr
VIGTASVENTAIVGPALHITPHDTMMESKGLLGFTVAEGSPPIPLRGTLPLTRTGTVTSTSDGCDPLPAGSLTGQIALIRRGGCTFLIKATHAQAAGAAGVILYNNAPEALDPSVAGTPALSVPVVAISGADGAALNAQMDAGAVTQTWGTSVISAANPLANTLSAFSSYGLTAELGFKPDIAAPGGSIYSTWPIELGAYTTLSGTSMASPHLAGTAALLLQARPGLSAVEVREILQNNAVPALAPSGLVADNVHRQGAGLVHIDAAARNPVRATPAKIALGESASGPVATTVSLHNEGAAAITYAITHLPALSTTGTTYAPTAVASGYASASFSATTLTVPPGGSADVNATITADAALDDGSLYGGYLVFTPQGADTTGTIRVPYSGFKGDYRRYRSWCRPRRDIPGSPTRRARTRPPGRRSPCKRGTRRASSPISITPRARSRSTWSRRRS